MSKHRSSQIQPSLLQRLTLCLVYSHAKGKLKRVLDRNGSSVSEGVIFNRGIKTWFPAWSPVKRQISMTWFPIWVTIPLKPLQTMGGCSGQNTNFYISPLCILVQTSAVLCSSVQFCAILCNLVHLNASQCILVHLSASQCKLVQLCNPVHLSASQFRSVHLSVNWCRLMQISACWCKSVQISASLCRLVQICAPVKIDHLWLPPKPSN